MADNEVAGATVPADPTTSIEPTTPVEAGEKTAPQDAQKTTGEAEAALDTSEESDEEKRPSGSQRLKRRLRMIEAEYAQREQEVEQLRRQLAAGGQKTEGKPGVDREPTENDFPNDYLAFERAKTAWEVRLSVREEINRERIASQQRAQAEFRSERMELHQENLEEARKRIPDFDKVLASGGKDINLKPEAVDEIISSDKSALLIYHLAQNPDKAHSLNNLTGRELAREIGRLEGRVHLPKPNTATKATAPPSQVRGTAAPLVNLLDPDMDMETYVRERQKQMKRA